VDERYSTTMDSEAVHTQLYRISRLLACRSSELSYILPKLAGPLPSYRNRFMDYARRFQSISLLLLFVSYRLEPAGYDGCHVAGVHCSLQDASRDFSDVVPLVDSFFSLHRDVIQASGGNSRKVWAPIKYTAAYATVAYGRGGPWGSRALDVSRFAFLDDSILYIEHVIASRLLQSRCYAFTSFELEVHM
jgi:hypothetical protein